nr:hypothetical protein B0A51_12362 [Rachicladosporium sp. CCFEE 5018]
MGRFATAVAAAGADAINMPPLVELPRISLLDALMPKSLSDLGKAVKAAKPPAKEEVPPRAPVIYYEVKKNRNGSRSLIAHRGAIGDNKADNKASNETSRKEKSKTQKGGDEGKVDAQIKGDAKTEIKGADIAWTADEDAKIKAMKADKKSWNEIAIEISRAKWQVQARFKEINVDGAAGDDKGNANGNEEKKSKGGHQADGNKKGNNNANDGGGEKGKKDKADNDNATKQDKKPNNQKSQPSKLATEDARFTMADWQTLQEDDLFSFSELQCLSEIIAKDPEMSWPRIAARFFDITGRRVHADDVREKFEGLAEKAYGG